MKSLSIGVHGMGEVGIGVAQLDRDAGFEVYCYDPKLKIHEMMLNNNADISHICFPYNDPSHFVLDCERIDHLYSPKYLVINSTVPIKVCNGLQNTIDAIVIHAPVRGTHPNMLAGLKKYVRFYGPADPKADLDLFFKDYVNHLGIKAVQLHSADECAAGKILSQTSWYGMLIAHCNMVYRFCMKNRLRFRDVYNAWLETDEVGKNYAIRGDRAVAREFIPRPIMYPNNIGGHCVMQNLEFIKDELPEFYALMQKYKEML